MGKIFKAIATGAEASADLAKTMAKFGSRAAGAMADAAKSAVRASKSMIGTATDMAKALKKVDGGSLSDAFKTMATKGDDIFDDGFKAVLKNAEAAAKRADDVADAAATAGKKGLLGSAADAAKTGAKRIKDACTSSAKAGAVCAATAGTSIYAGVWWQQETKAGKKRSACRGLCMPKNTDDFVGSVFSEIGKDQLQFKTLEDVQEMFPEATSNTLTEYPLCQDTEDINNLADCKALCDAECEEAHPKSIFFESLVTDTAGVAGKAVGTAAGAALGAAADASGASEFWEKNKKILIGVGAGIIAIILLIVVINLSGKKGAKMPAPRRMPVPPGYPGFY